MDLSIVPILYLYSIFYFPYFMPFYLMDTLACRENISTKQKRTNLISFHYEKNTVPQVDWSIWSQMLCSESEFAAGKWCFCKSSYFGPPA